MEVTNVVLTNKVIKRVNVSVISSCQDLETLQPF